MYYIQHCDHAFYTIILHVHIISIRREIWTHTQIFPSHYCLLKCMYQPVRLSGRVHMCKGYPFYPPFLQCSDLNLNFFRRCDTCFNFSPFFTLFILLEFIHLMIFAYSTLFGYTIKYDFIYVL